MKPHLLYGWYVIRHKWFVLLAGLRVVAPVWRLLIHDWSKLTPYEWTPYVWMFYDRSREGSDAYELEQVLFDQAWLRHQHRNRHHWQHWVLREDGGGTKALEMPEKYAREMLADWMGAGRAITGRWEVASWYQENQDRIVLHPATRLLVEELISIHGEPR